MRSRAITDFCLSYSVSSPCFQCIPWLSLRARTTEYTEDTEQTGTRISPLLKRTTAQLGELIERECVAVRIFEPCHARATREGHNSQLVLGKAVEENKLDAPIP